MCLQAFSIEGKRRGPEDNQVRAGRGWDFGGKLAGIGGGSRVKLDNG